MSVIYFEQNGSLLSDFPFGYLISSKYPAFSFLLYHKNMILILILVILQFRTHICRLMFC